MRQIQCKRSVSDQRPSQVADDADRADSEEAALHKASADWYERRWRARIKNQQTNLWVVGGVYLILASMAYVVI